MVRCAVALTCVLAAAVALSAQDEKDPVKEKLFAAKVTYDKDMSAFRKTAGEWFDKREEIARKAGDKKALDQVKVDRTTFDADGLLPKTAPPDLQQRQVAPRKALETAYVLAVKDYIKGKKDDEAAATEKALLDFRKSNWRHIDLSRVTFHDGFIRIPPDTEVPTVQKHTGDVEIVLVARTESENIRLHAQRTARLIFNWEVNPRELRVHRPDGTGDVNSGSTATAKVMPLKPNTWYTLRWRLTEEGTQVAVDGMAVFEEKRRNDLTAEMPVLIKSIKSPIDVKEFRVTPLAKPR